MKKIKIIILLITVFGLYLSMGSCNRQDLSKQSAIVDSLFIQVSLFKVDIDNLDSAAIMANVKPINEDLAWIQDSLSRESVMDSKEFIENVKNGQKIMSIFPREYAVLKKELSYSLKQLTDIKADLKADILTVEEANKYVNDEEKAAEILKKHHDKLLGRLSRIKNYSEVRKDFYIKVHEQGLISE
jgi:hypothetical protein